MERRLSLLEQINQLPQLDSAVSFGKDIDEVHNLIFSTEDVSDTEKIFRKWASAKQPCLFGKLASKKIKGLDYHLTIIHNITFLENESVLFDYLRAERLRFKKRALEGEVSAHLIYFIHPRLAYARPGRAFMALQKRICEMHMPECYPVEEDVIYTESVPYRDPEGVKIYKAGVNVFYSAAHNTRNHDRRVPGGFLISVNAPGHFMRLALNKKIYDNAYQALGEIRTMTEQSVGRGGIAHHRKISTTWHHIEKVNRAGCPVAHNDSAYYGGFYHTDVLIPGALTCDDRLLDGIDPHDPMIFGWNVLFYVSLEPLSSNDPYYGEFIGIPVQEEATFFNPFSPRRFKDGPLSVKEEAV